MAIVVLAQKSWKKFREQCPRCESLLEYESDDVRYSRPLLEHSIECPVCDERILVNDPDRRRDED